jgi:CelD/BcsL family acetyltransferase involved in cellulose biosynthesis
VSTPGAPSGGARTSRAGQGRRTTSKVVVGFDELMRYSEALDALLRSADAPAAARWGPLVTWMRHHRRMTPWAVLARRNGEVVAAALLVRVRRGAAYRFETMGEAHLPSWIPARDPDSAAELASALSRELAAIRRPWVMHLRALETTDPVAAEIVKRLRVVRSEQEFCSPRLEFVQGEPLNSYLSRNTRSAAAKARNRIKRANLVCEMGWTRDLAAIDSAIPEIADLYQKRNVQRNQSVGLLEDARYRSFFTDMMHTYAADGLVRLLTLRLEGQLASYALCLEGGGLLFVYSNRTSADWLEFSPGRIANAEVVRTAYEDPQIRAVDWGSGIERYKISSDAALHPYEVVNAWSSKTARYAWTHLHGRRSLRPARPGRGTNVPHLSAAKGVIPAQKSSDG